MSPNAFGVTSSGSAYSARLAGLVQGRPTPSAYGIQEAHGGSPLRRAAGIRARHVELSFPGDPEEQPDGGVPEAGQQLPRALGATRAVPLRPAVGAEEGHDVGLSVAGNGLEYAPREQPAPSS